jgi:hypothetical protein
MKELEGQLNAGINPELIALGTELAMFHMEAGVRKFADVAKAIAEDLGIELSRLRGYMRSWYNGARDAIEDHGLPVVLYDDSDIAKTAHKELFATGGTNVNSSNEGTRTRGDATAPVNGGQVSGTAGNATIGDVAGEQPDTVQEPGDEGDTGSTLDDGTDVGTDSRPRSGRKLSTPRATRNDAGGGNTPITTGSARNFTGKLGTLPIFTLGKLGTLPIFTLLM